MSQKYIDDRLKFEELLQKSAHLSEKRLGEELRSHILWTDESIIELYPKLNQQNVRYRTENKSDVPSRAIPKFGLKVMHGEQGIFPNERKIVFMQDGAIAHTAKASLSLIKTQVSTVWSKGVWAANGPDLNPLKNQWSILKENVYKEPQPRTREELEKWDRTLLTPCIFEESGFVPREMERKPFFRYIFGSWLLICGILTNCYNGLMITELNAPLPGYSPEMFEDLICGTPARRVMSSYLNRKKVRGELALWFNQQFGGFLKTWGSRQFLTKPFETYKNSTSCFSLLSHPISEKYRGIGTYEFSQFQLEYAFSPYDETVNDVSQIRLSKHSLVMYLLLNPSHPRGPKCEGEAARTTSTYSKQGLLNSIETEILKCERTVFVAKSTELRSEKAFYKKHYDWIHFHEGRDTLDAKPFGFQFDLEGNSRVPEYFKSLFETGVYIRLEKEGLERKYSSRSPVVRRGVEKLVPLTLNGGNDLIAESGLGTDEAPVFVGNKMTT
ncbi:Transposable element Tc3 transposase [Folsomia candida]|uniref:Transposable element Tc3 transposase n=1 Tax=Folsomia candida TaxID=158441 RepID=A0A226CXG5_FOLCA|nr:Transposable element Tc3 transposase [Folsomia candida]